jgi:DMSO/TMAO reductase YedYZ heme-binding membrane subunit
LSVIPSPRLKRPVGTPVDDIPVTAALLAAVAVAGGALVVGTWWRAAPLSVGPGAALMDAGRLAGLLAGYVALLQVLLRARLPFVERGLGTDSINEAHHLLGGYIFALIIGHAALITTGYAAAAGTSVPQELAALVGYPYVLLAMIAACLLAGIVISSLPLIRRRLPHEAWHCLHLLVYGALALAFFHQISVGEHFRLHPILHAAWTTLFAGAAAALIVFRFLRPIFLSVRHRLAVASVVHETANVVSIRITGRNLNRLRASPDSTSDGDSLHRAHGTWRTHFPCPRNPGGRASVLRCGSEGPTHPCSRGFRPAPESSRRGPAAD